VVNPAWTSAGVTNNGTGTTAFGNAFGTSWIKGIAVLFEQFKVVSYKLIY